MSKVLLPVLLGPSQVAVSACPNCGMTLQHLRQTSVLGCSDCYRHFREVLLLNIQRMQGTIYHKARAAPSEPTPLPGPPTAALPASAPAREETEELQRLLDLAVAEERYEDAASIRDQIRARQS